tara:strand:- start:42559 stop:43323 length:765 start_codon:yes stop_codon:yes gene_type:complete
MRRWLPFILVLTLCSLVPSASAQRRANLHKPTAVAAKQTLKTKAQRTSRASQPKVKLRLGASAKAAGSKGSQTGNAFQRFHQANPTGIWAKNLKPEVTRALADFNKPKGGLGHSMKNLDLRAMSFPQIEQLLKSRGFVREDGTIKNFVTKQPERNAKGEVLRQVFFAHSDGGMVRVKPDGYPGSPRPQPHVVKSVRFSGKDTMHDFAREAFKVNNAGLPIPKAPSDLHNPHPSTSAKALKYIDAWANVAHTDVK